MGMPTCDAGVVTVHSDFDPNSVYLGDCSVSDTDITEGESVSIETEVYNDGDYNANVAVDLLEDGTVIQEFGPVEVFAGGDFTLRDSAVTPDGTGEYSYTFEIVDVEQA